jgi:hypothetical protein
MRRIPIEHPLTRLPSLSDLLWIEVEPDVVEALFGEEVREVPASAAEATDDDMPIDRTDCLRDRVLAPSRFLRAMAPEDPCGDRTVVAEEKRGDGHG